MFDDKYAVIDFENFIKDIDLDIIIETGTKLGKSTIKLKKYCKFIHTIELNPQQSRKAQENFNDALPTDKKSVRFWIGDTRDKLKEVLKTITKNQNVLFFLDAHRHVNGHPEVDNNPLLEELSTIMKFIKMQHLKEPHIIIDDFANPENENIKHNIYGRGDCPLNIEYVKEDLDSIYGKNGYEVYYTEKVERPTNSGKIFIKPKEKI